MVGWVSFRADDGLEAKINETVEALKQQGIPGVSKASVIRLMLRRSFGFDDAEAVRVEVLRQLHKRVADGLRYAMVEISTRIMDHIDDQTEVE